MSSFIPNRNLMTRGKVQKEKPKLSEVVIMAWEQIHFNVRTSDWLFGV